MARKTECYVDTSALIAFMDRSDSHHPLFRQLFFKPPALYLRRSLVIFLNAEAKPPRTWRRSGGDEDS